MKKIYACIHVLMILMNSLSINSINHAIDKVNLNRARAVYSYELLSTKVSRDTCLYGYQISCFSHTGIYVGRWNGIKSLSTGIWSVVITYSKNGIRHTSGLLSPFREYQMNGEVTVEKIQLL